MTSYDRSVSLAEPHTVDAPPTSALKKIGRWLGRDLPGWTASSSCSSSRRSSSSSRCRSTTSRRSSSGRGSPPMVGDMWSQHDDDGLGDHLAEVAVSARPRGRARHVAGVALARKPGSWTVGFIAIVLLILVTPEIVDGAGAAELVRPARWAVPGGADADRARPHRVRVGRRHAHRAGRESPDRRPPRGSSGRSVRDRRQGVLPDHAAPGDARRCCPGRCCRSRSASTTSSRTSFVSPAGNTTFPNYVFGLSGGVIRPEVAAMSTVFIGITLASIAIVGLLLRRQGQSGTEIATTFTGN